MEHIDDQLVRQAASGNIRAFEEIYKIVSPYVFTLALRSLNNTHDAQEVTQDVFLKIHRNLKQFRFDSSFKTWIYRIALNTSINMLKKRSKERQRHTEFDEAHMKGQTLTHADNTNIDKEDAGYRVKLFMQHLNEDQKICLMLREIDGLSYQEIADVLEVNLNTVRTRIKRAREALLEIKEKDEVSHEM